MPEIAPKISGETERITEAYAKRKREGKDRLYSWYQQSSLWEKYRLRSVAAELMRRHGWYDLSMLHALDIGCGAGGWLRTLLDWGVPPSQLHGIDLLEDRIAYACTLAPHMNICQASGWSIPHESSSMDLVSAHTVFSSILDGDARRLLAGEMARVAKPGGLLMVFDFCIADPRNRDTVGIPTSEIRRIFPDMPLQKRSLLLPPPILRRLAPVSPFLAAMTEWLLPMIRTHRVYMLRKE